MDYGCNVGIPAEKYQLFGTAVAECRGDEGVILDINEECRNCRLLSKERQCQMCYEFSWPHKTVFPVPFIIYKQQLSNFVMYKKLSPILINVNMYIYIIFI